MYMWFEIHYPAFVAFTNCSAVELSWYEVSTLWLLPALIESPAVSKRITKYCSVPAVGVGINAVVKLKCWDSECNLQLVSGRLHIPTIKNMFGLSSVDVDGVATPADDRGFTFATYLPGSTLQISGMPAAGLSTPLDILCCTVGTVPLVLISPHEGYSHLSRATLLCPLACLRTKRLYGCV